MKNELLLYFAMAAAVMTGCKPKSTETKADHKFDSIPKSAVIVQKIQEKYPNGEVKYTGKIVNGDSAGIWSFYNEEHSSRRIIEFYPHGKRKSVEDFCMGPEEDFNNGIHIEYYKSGAVSDDYRYDAKGFPVGKGYEYYETGEVRKEFDYPERTYKGFFKDGTLESECRLDRKGEFNGHFRQYFKNGQVERSEYYSHGAPVGTAVKYDEDGLLIERTKFYSDHYKRCKINTDQAIYTITNFNYDEQKHGIEYVYEDCKDGKHVLSSGYYWDGKKVAAEEYRALAALEASLKHKTARSSGRNGETQDNGGYYTVTSLNDAMEKHGIRYTYEPTGDSGNGKHVLSITDYYWNDKKVTADEYRTMTALEASLNKPKVQPAVVPADTTAKAAAVAGPKALGL